MRVNKQYNTILSKNDIQGISKQYFIVELLNCQNCQKGSFQNNKKNCYSTSAALSAIKALVGISMVLGAFEDQKFCYDTCLRPLLLALRLALQKKHQWGLH